MNEEWTKCINWGRSVMQLSLKNFNSQGHFVLCLMKVVSSTPRQKLLHSRAGVEVGERAGQWLEDRSRSRGVM